MKKLCRLLLFAIAVPFYCLAQTDTTIYLDIRYDTALVGIQQDSIFFLPVFTDTNVNNITSKYDFTVFERVVPFSRFPDMHHLYKVKSSNTRVAEELKSSFPDLFPYYEIVNPAIPTSVRYTPQ